MFPQTDLTDEQRLHLISQQSSNFVEPNSEMGKMIQSMRHLTKHMKSQKPTENAQDQELAALDQQIKEQDEKNKLMLSK